MIIRANILMNNKKHFSAEFIINWMKDNKVFELLFDPKTTHEAIV
jgi:hypothetical protein